MQNSPCQNNFRSIPPVNEILQDEYVQKLSEKHGRQFILNLIREICDNYRKQLNDSGVSDSASVSVKELLVERLKTKVLSIKSSGLKRVVNGTGIILHTNLGRAPIPEAALKAATDAATGYSNLEYDLENGTRGSRHTHISEILKEITGAESALVVNNNAAAVFLCLNTLATGRGIIVSRGEQVEIGGSFRIPDIINRSGAQMVEVGTTNRTRLSDYEHAINESTGVLLKVHTSNYRIIGFTEEVQMKELAQLARRYGIPLINDLGSGSVIGLERFGLADEPKVQDSIKEGADIITFSGDKLLGGPQAGIIAGKKDLIDKILKNPLLRMLRPDKLTIAALYHVLSLYMDTEKAVKEIPVLRMLSKEESYLRMQAEVLSGKIGDLPGELKAETVEVYDEVGGGALPGKTLKGAGVQLWHPAVSPEKLQKLMRAYRIPVICRIHRDKLVISMRTINEEDYADITDCVSFAFKCIASEADGG